MNIVDACFFASDHPVREWPEEVFAANILHQHRGPLCPLAAVCVALGHCASLTDARTRVKAGEIRVNGAVVRDPAYVLQPTDLLFGRWVVVSRGKYGHRCFQLAKG